jgi:hypothetical protein
MKMTAAGATAAGIAPHPWSAAVADAPAGADCDADVEAGASPDDATRARNVAAPENDGTAADPVVHDERWDSDTRGAW